MIETKGLAKNQPAVYEIRCLVNGMTYIGQTKDYRRRIREHRYSLRRGCHRNPHLQQDFNLYGEHNFESSILSTDESKLDMLEITYIDSARSTNLCYNVFSGGSSGYTATQEFRDKVSRANTGKFVSEETRKKHSADALAQWQKHEYRSRMTESAKQQWSDETYRQIMHDAHVNKPDACGHKLCSCDVLEMRRRYETGESISKLSSEFGVTYSTGRAAILANTWKNI